MPRLALALFMLGTSIVLVPAAHAQTCSGAGPLAVRTPLSVPASPTTAYFYAGSATSHWNAVGVRPSQGTDWDLVVGLGGLPPGCSTGTLATSAAGTNVVDFVMTDFTLATPGPLAVRLDRLFGPGSAMVEYDRNEFQSEALTPDGEIIQRTWAVERVLECWDVPLEGGHAYTIDFVGSPNVQLFLFRNPGSGLYAAGRSGAVLQTATSTTFTPPSTGNYGAVVVKSDNLTAHFDLSIGECALVYVLPEGGAMNFGGVTQARMQFTPTPGRWGVVGMRHDYLPSTLNCDLALYGTGSAGWPTCFSPLERLAMGNGYIDLFVGDFRTNAPGPRRLRGFQTSAGAPIPMRFASSGPARVIGVNDPPLAATFVPDDLFHLYEVYLVAGQTYDIPIVGFDGVNLYGHSDTGEYWATFLEAVGAGRHSITHTAQWSGYYALLVPNPLARGANYTLAVNAVGTAGAGDAGPPGSTRLAAPSPNPARDGATIRYALAVPGRVRLDVVDLAGRRVWSRDQGRQDAGRFQVALTRAAAIPAGLYFVRLEVDGRVVGSERMTVLE